MASPRPTFSDISNASLATLVKALGVLIGVLFAVQLFMGWLMLESLQVLKSIDDKVDEPPSEVVIVDEEILPSK